MVNFKCRVLCRTRYIPAKIPILPPRAAVPSSVASGMRQAPRLAFLLSASISRKPTALIMIRHKGIECSSIDGNFLSLGVWYEKTFTDNGAGIGALRLQRRADL